MGYEVGTMMAEVAWLAMIHGVWLGLAAAAVAGMVLGRRERLGPEGRCRLLWAAVLMAGLGPFGIAVVHREIARQEDSTGREVRVSMAVAEAEESGRPLEESRPGEVLAEVRRAADGGVSLLEAARPVVLAVWGLGFVLAASVLAMGVAASLRIKAAGSIAPERAARIAGTLARGMGMVRAPDVLVHDRVVEPGLHGFLRPAVLLPVGWVEAATAGEIAAVLAHELAHASRRDPLANLVQRVLEAVFFFHPAFRWLSASLRHQREHRADAVAVRLTGDPLALARALENFGRARRRPSRFGPIVPAFAGDSSHVLLNRIQEILGMMPQNRRFNLWPVVALPVAFALAVVAMMQPVMAAEEPTQQAKPAPAPALMEAEGPMICYEVRILEMAPEAADRLPKPDLKVIKADAMDAGLITDHELAGLLEAAADPRAGIKVHTLPKVGSWEGAGATFIVPDDPLKTVPEGTETIPGIYVMLSGRHAEGQLQMKYTVGRTFEKAEDRADLRTWITCSQPDRTTIALRPKDPAVRFVDGRERVIVVTSRYLVVGKNGEVVEGGAGEDEAGKRP
jgi:beta-lactamase regulating signal transducer with metallopeptidase domain